MNDGLAPGVLAIVVGLTVDIEHNGLCVELYEFSPVRDECFYDPLDKCYYRMMPEDLADDMVTKDWWGCICPSKNEYLMFMPKNLLPIGNKSPEKEKEKDKPVEHVE